MLRPSDFDDHHLIAIIIVSGCKLICSDDSRLIHFLGEETCTHRSVSHPKIYSHAINGTILLR